MTRSFFSNHDVAAVTCPAPSPQRQPEHSQGEAPKQKVGCLLLGQLLTRHRLWALGAARHFASSPGGAEVPAAGSWAGSGTEDSPE